MLILLFKESVMVLFVLSCLKPHIWNYLDGAMVSRCIRVKVKLQNSRTGICSRIQLTITFPGIGTHT